jgi:hypothetical protein
MENEIERFSKAFCSVIQWLCAFLIRQFLKSEVFQRDTPLRSVALKMLWVGFRLSAGEIGAVVFHETLFAK